MRHQRTSGVLLRLYPSGFRARYGEELEALILETSDGRIPWRVRVDVALAALRERLHAAGFAGTGPSGERMRSGTLLVLAAWAVFVVAGIGVQRFSEHWRAATPIGHRGLPAAAFHALLAGAATGSVLVLAGVGIAAPSLVRFLRAGGGRQVTRHLLFAVGLTVAAGGALAGLVAWAHGLDAWRRNGHDAAYATGAAACGVLLIGALAAWTVAGSAIARRLDLSPTLLRVETWLAAALALMMVTMTAATAVWWAALAHSAPAFFAADPAGKASPLAPVMLAATLLMVLASAAAAIGAGRAVSAAGRKC